MKPRTPRPLNPKALLNPIGENPIVFQGPGIWILQPLNPKA